MVEQAEAAFLKGQDLEAIQYSYAAALVSPEAQETLADDFKWVPSLKRPTMGVRWGIGVVYSPPKGYTGPPSPLGYVAPVKSTTGAPGMPGGATTTPGTTTQGDKPKRSRVFGQRQQQQNQPGGATTASNTPPAPVSHPPADPTEFLNYYTGEIGEQVVEVLSKRNSSGVHGNVLRRAMDVYDTTPTTPAAGTPGMPMAMMPAMSPGAQDKKQDFKPGAILPGVVMLGEGSENDLIETAEAHQVDYIIFFEVSVRAAGKNVTNNTKFRVLPLDKANLPEAAEGESSHEIYASKLINNQRVESAREAKKDDPLEAEITAFAEAIEQQVAPVPLSEKVSAPEVAVKRTAFLASKPGENLLSTLAEIKCYEAQKLIDETQAASAFEQLLGAAPAKKLLTGKTEAERVTAIAKLLPKPAR